MGARRCQDGSTAPAQRMPHRLRPQSALGTDLVQSQEVHLRCDPLHAVQVVPLQSVALQRVLLLARNRVEPARMAHGAVLLKHLPPELQVRRKGWGPGCRQH